MKTSIVSLLSILLGVISAEYVGPQNGNGNGNGNAYGVPTDSIIPPQPQGGPYPPSGWKPAGPRLLLPGEARNAQQPNGNGFGQAPPSQYGPVNPAPSGPSIDNQYGPAPPNNQYIPGSGFGNGNGGNGNGHNGNGGNGNGHNGNGGNGNGHNGNGGNGHSGNGGNGNGGNGHNGGNGGNGNGHNGGNGFGNGNGNGNGNGHNGNGNGGGNGFTSPGNGNGFSNGNGNGGNGFGNGANGNGHNGNGNGNGSKNGNGGNGSNGFSPAFHGSFPGVVYPFVQHSVPAVLAFRPGNGAGHGSIYPVYQVSISPSQSGTGIIDPSLFSLAGAYPSFQTPLEASALGGVHPGFAVAGAHQVSSTQPAIAGQGAGLISHRLEPYYTLLTNHQSQKSQIEGVKNGLSNLQFQYAISQPTHGNLGVPVGVF